MTRPPRLYRVLVGAVRFVMRVFFGEIVVEGRENIPTDRGGLLVSWHPNGLIDPALIVTHMPAHIVFGARDGLLRWPILGWVMRRMGTVPIYRAADQAGMDADARRAANEQSLDALAAAIARGSFSALFPEGVSHDQPHLAEIRSGAARLYDRARALSDPSRSPALIPVGLHYDRKNLFRSRVLIVFHRPMVLPPELDVVPEADEPEAARSARARALTERIRQTLVTVVRATDDWVLHTLMHRAGALIHVEAAVRAGRAPETHSLVERHVRFSQIWHGFQARRETHAEEIAGLRADLTRYHRVLRTMGMEDADLDAAPRLASPLLWAILMLQALTVFLLLPPVLVTGYAINGPTHLLIQALARRFSAADKDTATVKILAGFVLYPLTWLLWAVVAAVLHVRLRGVFPGIPDTPLLVGLAVFALGLAGGVLALTYNDLARATARAVRVRLTRARRRRTVEALRTQRADLHDRFVALGEGLVLPASATDDPLLTVAHSGAS
jgi:1-acyl-sn-glycerol-3-phosphate acyltransferase